jgi:hypothetical protein
VRYPEPPEETYNPDVWDEYQEQRIAWYRSRIRQLETALRGLVEAEQFMDVVDPLDADDVADGNEMMADAMKAAEEALAAMAGEGER